jgi:PEGA domain
VSVQLCPRCAKVIPEGQKTACPSCGGALPPVPKPEKDTSVSGAVKVIALLFLLCFGAPILAGLFFFKHEAKDHRTCTVQSTPADAQVYEDDTLLGTTPVVIYLDHDDSVSLVLAKDGFTPTPARLTRDALRDESCQLSVTLTPKN